jgi:hypothetical protein
MMTIDTDTLRLGWLPVEWQELAEVVLIGHPRQAGEDVFEVRERVLAVALAGDDITRSPLPRQIPHRANATHPV